MADEAELKPQSEREMHGIESLRKLVDSAMDDPAVPKLYCNGFVNSLTNGDMVIGLMRNGRPVAIINLSYTMAKSLAEKVGELITQLEHKSGHNIMSSDEAARYLIGENDG
jgi:hypothetical protein